VNSIIQMNTEDMSIFFFKKEKLKLKLEVFILVVYQVPLFKTHYVMLCH